MSIRLREGAEGLVPRAEEAVAGFEGAIRGAIRIVGVSQGICWSAKSGKAREAGIKHGSRQLNGLQSSQARGNRTKWELVAPVCALQGERLPLNEKIKSCASPQLARDRKRKERKREKEAKKKRSVAEWEGVEFELS